MYFVDHMHAYIYIYIYIYIHTDIVTMLQLPLHLLVLLLKGKNTGSSVLTFIISGPTLHFLLVTEIQLN